MEQETSCHAYKITLQKPMLGFAEEAGKAERAEGKREVQEYLGGMNHLRPGNKLQNTVSQRSDNAYLGAVPIAYQAYD